MKKITIALLAFVAITLVSCGGSNGEANRNVSNDQKSSDSVGDKNPASSPKTETNFTLAVIPDTQFYSQNYPDIFASQTRWIAANYKKENIKFSTHLGDIVQNPSNKAEWFSAVKAMANLDVNPETPYSILAGNHDIPALLDSAYGSWTLPHHYDEKRNPKNEFFTRYFPVEKQKKNFKTFQGADSTGLNSYHIFADDDGQQYLVLALDWRISDNTIDWVDSILEKHAKLPVILTTHELLDPRVNKGELPKWTSNGKRLWNKLIKNNDQIFITFNGHWNGEGYRIEKNECGRNVILVAVDYQGGISRSSGDTYNGGNGLLQLVTFNKAANRLDMRSYSPYVQEKLNIVNALPGTLKMNEKDELERWKLQIPMDFKERFSNFNQASNCK